MFFVLVYFLGAAFSKSRATLQLLVQGILGKLHKHVINIIYNTPLKNDGWKMHFLLK